MNAVESNNKNLENFANQNLSFGLGVTLSYVGGNSDKFWSVVWQDKNVSVHYGRHGSKGNVRKKEHIYSIVTAAYNVWGLLRDKTSDGYTVADAAVVAYDLSNKSSHQIPSFMVETWNLLREERGRDLRPLDHPELVGKSSRTPDEGKRVLLDVVSPHPSMETLLKCATADMTERFLPPLVLSRPDIPEQASFMAALAGHINVWV